MKLLELHGHQHLKHVPIRPRLAHPQTKLVDPKKPHHSVKPITPPKERKKPQRIHF
jgi:hypothetical protein